LLDNFMGKELGCEHPIAYTLGMNLRVLSKSLVWLAVLVLVGCGSTSTKTSDSRPRATKQNVDYWALAAVESLQVQGDSAGALANIQRAVQAQPQRADLTWLWLSLCLRSSGCAPDPIEGQLRKLDAANAAVWLAPLARAQKERDARSEAQILEAIGKVERFDVYWNSLLWRLATVRASGAPEQQRLPVTTALNEVAAMLSAVILPSLQPLVLACSGDRVMQKGVATRCKQVARVLENGDSIAAEGVGLGIEQRIYQEGTPESVVVADRIQTLRARRDTAAAVIESQVEREKFSVQYLELLKKLRREQDVTDAILRWSGEGVTRER
jgi:hypothetical protein